jgi:hypothetical protein
VRIDGRGWVPVELTNGGGAQLRPLSP